MFQKIKNVFKPQLNVNEVIAEIHESFDTATERLLKEANDIVSKTGQYSIDKSERLKGLGFISSKPVIDTLKAVEAKQKMEEISKNVIYFKVRYPNNKFITEEMVNTICKRYNLVFGDVSYYEGDIPERNILEMENFKLNNEDFTTESDFVHYQKVYVSYKPIFKICAPESEFDMTYLERIGNKLELHIPDPIVLQPVNGGYLIISKWGLEADDKDLVNETMN